MTLRPKPRNQMFVDLIVDLIVDLLP